MKTSINKIRQYPAIGKAQELLRRIEGYTSKIGPDVEFRLSLLLRSTDVLLTDILFLLGQEGKSVLLAKFSSFCVANTQCMLAAELSRELTFLLSKSVPLSTVREVANNLKRTCPTAMVKGCEADSPIWRTRRTMYHALLCKGSADQPGHAGHYAAYAYQWSVEVNPHGHRARLIQLLQEEKDDG